MKLKIFILLFLINISNQSRPLPINLSLEDPVHNDLKPVNFSDNHHDNQFMINLEDKDMVKDNLFFLILESNNPNLYISIFDDETSISNKNNSKMDLVSTNGNIMMVMSDKYFNGHFNFFKKSRKLRFKVVNDIEEKDVNYEIKVFVQKQAYVNANKIYTTRVDQTVEEFLVLSTYDEKQKDIEKIRFQCQVVEKQDDDFSLKVELKDPNGGRYVLNEIFKDTVGGMLTKGKFDICEGKQCSYTLIMRPKGIQLMNIESKLSQKIEVLDYYHVGPQYERKYDDDQMTHYLLKYDKEVQNMDISITLIPVTGQTGLFINPNTLPTSKENYIWSKEGPLAKRITIKWEELEQMKSNESDFYISVYNKKQGEFFLQVDAHQQGIRGKLKKGVIEGGFVVYEEIQNYVHRFQIFKTQDIEFNIEMHTQSGDADLYIKQCESLIDCQFDKDNLSDGISIRNTQSKKVINHKFQCKHDKNYESTICNFSIAVVGKENNGTHYDLVLHMNKQHRLMTPGHQLNLTFQPQEKQFFKLSFPHSSFSEEKLFLEIESIWGNFNIFVGKNEFPNQEESKIQETFYSTKQGLLHSLKSINLNEKISDLQGQIYVTVEAITSCSMNIRFIEKNQNGIGIQTIKAGEQLRGTINGQEIAYYSIKASLNKILSKSIQIVLTPIKGKYILFTSRGGKIPNQQENNLMTKNNIMELTYDDYQNKEEHIIGVQLQEQNQNQEEYQFYISFNYSNKPLMLKPGVLSSFRSKEKNIFVIELVKGMGDVLILKSIKDGHNITICAVFSDNQDQDQQFNCDFRNKGKDTSLFIQGKKIQKNCENRTKCYLLLNVESREDQEFTLGYTYNDHPFKMTLGSIINGPNILKGDRKIDFILHPENSKPIQIYFNTKGLPLNIYCKLIDANTSKDEMLLPFPNKNDYDEQNHNVIGNVTNIYYNTEDVKSKGSDVELLLSVRPYPSADTEEDTIYDGRVPFILQSPNETFEILRTEVTHYQALEEQYDYFHFYNNGTSDNLRVYIVAEDDSLLDVILSRNLYAKPPFKDSYLLRKSQIGSVELNLERDFSKNENDLKGHYTLVVKSSNQVYINIYWTNKPNINYIEITPGLPYKKKLTDNKLYFTFYIKDVDHPTKEGDRDHINIYFKTDVRADVFISKTDPSNLTIPSQFNNNFKGSTGREGGISYIKIDKNSPDYCVSCTYIGYVQSVEEGFLDLFVDIEHTNIPIFLLQGFTFPMTIEKEKVFRVYNADTDLMYVNFSILSGEIEYQISNSLEFKGDSTSIGKKIRFKQAAIRPSDFDVSEASNYYIKIKNLQTQFPSYFNISLVKNSLRQSLEIGVKKVVEVNEFESSEFLFKPQQGKYFIQIELIGLGDKTLKKSVKKNLLENVKLYQQNDDGKKYPLKHEQLTDQDNSVYFILETIINQNIILEIFNKVKTMAQLAVLVSNNNYQMLNLDEKNYRVVNNGQYSVYEVHGHKGEKMFFEVNMCYGESKVEFYEDDYNKISQSDKIDHKTIKDYKKLTHYITMKSNKAYIKVQVPQKQLEKGELDMSIFTLNAFTEKHLEENEYSEVSIQNEGQIFIDTEYNKVSFKHIYLNSKYDESYTHRVTYNVYLSDVKQAMKYTRSCGDFMRSSLYPDSEVFHFKREFLFKNKENFDKVLDDLIEVHYSGLEGAKKYFGIVVVNIALMGSDEFSIKPIKEAITHYDEFVLVTSRFNLNLNVVMGLILSLTFLICLYIGINDFVFGSISKYQQFNKLTDLQNEEINLFGFDSVSLLEQEYYDQKDDSVPQAKVEVIDQEDTHDDNSIEMTNN